MLNNTLQRIKSIWNDGEPQQDHTPQQMQELEPRMLLSATTLGAIPDAYISASGGTTSVNLNDYFDDDEISGTLVRFTTVYYDANNDPVYGTIDLELFDDDAPVTVENFLSYLDSGAYDDTFFHRSVRIGQTEPGNSSASGIDILQGGGFRYESPATYEYIATGATPILNESGISNTRGTIAMARGDHPDSATSQWFFNLDDANTSLDGDSSSGYAVFGRVLGDGMDVIDDLASIPIWNAQTINSAFGSLPLSNFANEYYPDEQDLVTVESVERLETELTYSIASRSDPTSIAATIDDAGVVTIFTIGTSIPETVTITIEATDHDGNTVQSTITVNIGAAQNSLDSDGVADIMWRNFSSGKNTLYDMQGINIDTIVSLDDVASNTFYIAAIGDMNQDGENDIVWHNAYDGRNVVWLMDGTTVSDVVELQTVANRKWIIAGVGDFNNDGHTDLLWRNTNSGKNVVWLMDQTANVDSMSLDKVADTNWYIGGVGDFDRDGATDIVWRNDATGQNKIWLLNAEDGSLKESVAVVTESNTGWVMSGVGDYNSDNQPDILWRNVNNGNVMIWVMDGTSYRVARKGIARVRNQAWQLPGRTSQLKAEAQAEAKIQRINRRLARSAAAASATLAAVQMSQKTESVLSMVEPIVTLNDGEDADLL